MYTVNIGISLSSIIYELYCMKYIGDYFYINN